MEKVVIEFFVPGSVVPWARAGGGKTMHKFTPTKQANYMVAIKTICAAAMKGAPPIEGPVAMTIEAIYPWPRHLSQKKRQDPTMRWKTSRADCSNITKIIEDALNLVAYFDDAQIADLHVRKVYAETPGLNVRIEVL